MTQRFRQFELFPANNHRTPDAVAAFLGAGGALSVKLAVTHNRVSMLSVRFEGASVAKVRMHEEFLAAPQHVLDALRAYLRSRRADQWAVVAEFASTITASPPGPRRGRRTRTRGDVHDLDAIRDKVNRDFFSGRATCRVAWGVRGRGQRGAQRSMRFGSYHRDDDQVLINPKLDHVDVPTVFIEYIVFHEILHSIVPAKRHNGRWVHHPREFNALERRFPEWEEMQRISKRLLDPDDAAG